MHTRRNILIAGCSALALAGCSAVTPTPTPAPVPVPPPGPTPTPSPTDVIGFINKIVQGLNNYAPQLQGVLAADVLAKVQTYLGEAAQLAAQITAAAASGSVISGLVGNFGGIVGSILDVLTTSGVNIPPVVKTIVSAINTVLPLILAFAGVVAGRRAMRATVGPAMDVQTALSVLDQAAAGKL